jgi:TPR repeat protein
LPAARFQIGRLYKQGRGAGKDTVAAARWYKLAADSRHTGAMLALGVLYEFGNGIDKDLAEALRLYRLAADAAGMTSLGFLYSQGKGALPILPRRWVCCRRRPIAGMPVRNGNWLSSLTRGAGWREMQTGPRCICLQRWRRSARRLRRSCWNVPGRGTTQRA